MSINGIRFRAEGELVVLQVSEYKRSHYSFESDVQWRDAKVQDLLDVADEISRMSLPNRGNSIASVMDDVPQR